MGNGNWRNQRYVILGGERSGTCGVAHSVHRHACLGYQVLTGGLPRSEAVALLGRLADRWGCPMYGHMS